MRVLEILVSIGLGYSVAFALAQIVRLAKEWRR